MSSPLSKSTRNAPDFSEWMRANYRLVLSQSRRMLLVKEDAEDVTQLVFTKAWKAWEGFEGNETQRKAWLLRIARNSIVDAARRRNLRRMVSIDTALEERTAAVLASDDFEGDRILALLHSAIAQLPPKQRWVFQARYFDARPYALLAKETGTSEGALKASYHHGRKKIERILEAQASVLFRP